MIVELLELTEAILVATTLSVGIAATGAAVIGGSAPPDILSYAELIAPPYESDDKRIIPEKELLKDQLDTAELDTDRFVR